MICLVDKLSATYWRLQLAKLGFVLLAAPEQEVALPHNSVPHNIPVRIPAG
jgi:hypothetical protein